MTLALFVVGLGLLIVGADALVRGASGIAARFGIPPLIVGLTVVALGTSSPEIAVSVTSALKGQGDIAVGNVVGSNILNVLFILGLAAVIAPLAVARQLVVTDVPFLIGASLLVWLLAADGQVSPFDGWVLLGTLVAYSMFLVHLARRGRAAMATVAVEVKLGQPLAVQAVMVVGGLGMLVLGSDWLVDGAVAVARAVGLSELTIGLTIVAMGTSLPEVASSVVAAIRGEREIAVGNIIGSNIYNTLAVLGLGAAVAPAGIGVSPAAVRFDLPVMVAVAVACLPILFTGHRIDRWEGALFLAYYVAYTLFLLLHARGHHAAEPFGTFMLAFVVPLTAITLAVLAIRALRSGASEKGEP